MQKRNSNTRSEGRVRRLLVWKRRGYAPITPATGLLALAYSFFGMRPAS